MTFVGPMLAFCWQFYWANVDKWRWLDVILLIGPTYFANGLFVVGPVPVVQRALHMLTTTMTCCQQLQPLSNVGPTIAWYLGNYDFNICIDASIFLDHVSNIGILFKVLLFHLNHTHTHTVWVIVLTWHPFPVHDTRMSVISTHCKIYCLILESWFFEHASLSFPLCHSVFHQSVFRIQCPLCIPVSWLVNGFEDERSYQRFYMCANSILCRETVIRAFWKLYMRFVCKIYNIFELNKFRTFTNFCHSPTTLHGGE